MRALHRPHQTVRTPLHLLLLNQRLNEYTKNRHKDCIYRTESNFVQERLNRTNLARLVTRIIWATSFSHSVGFETWKNLHLIQPFCWFKTGKNLHLIQPFCWVQNLKELTSRQSYHSLQISHQQTGFLFHIFMIFDTCHTRDIHHLHFSYNSCTLFSGIPGNLFVASY